MMSTTPNPTSILSQAWEGNYSDQQSEISKIHKHFLNKLEEKRISEQTFSQQLKACPTNLDRITSVLNILPWDLITFSTRLITSTITDSSNYADS